MPNTKTKAESIREIRSLLTSKSITLRAAKQMLEPELKDLHSVDEYLTVGALTCGRINMLTNYLDHIISDLTGEPMTSIKFEYMKFTKNSSAKEASNKFALTEGNDEFESSYMFHNPNLSNEAMMQSKMAFDIRTSLNHGQDIKSAIYKANHAAIDTLSNSERYAWSNGLYAGWLIRGEFDEGVIHPAESPSDACRKAGLCSLGELSEISGESEQNLINWFTSRSKRFKILLAGAVTIKASRPNPVL